MSKILVPYETLVIVLGFTIMSFYGVYFLFLGIEGWSVRGSSVIVVSSFNHFRWTAGPLMLNYFLFLKFLLLPIKQKYNLREREGGTPELS